MPPAQTDQWPNISELLDQASGHIGIGRMPLIESAAVAVTETELIASLVRRSGENFPELLNRMDAAIGKALHKGVMDQRGQRRPLPIGPPARRGDNRRR